MKVKTSSKVDNNMICRTNKSSVPMIRDKRKFYYMDIKEDEDGEKKIFYVLLDNSKGKKETHEFDSLADLEKFVKK